MTADISDRTPEEWRGPLLEAMLSHVPFDGWTRTALGRAAQDLSLDPALANLAFPGGMADVADFYLSEADRQMTEELIARGVDKMKIRDRITQAVLIRLEQAQTHKETARRLAGWLALPRNGRRSAKWLWRTADAMWRAAGDTSTDYNWYTKRTILSGVYSSTLLAWLGDDNEDFAATRAFLDRRIAGVMQFEKTKAKILNARANIPDLSRFLGRLRYPQTR